MHMKYFNELSHAEKMELIDSALKGAVIERHDHGDRWVKIDVLQSGDLFLYGENIYRVKPKTHNIVIQNIVWGMPYGEEEFVFVDGIKMKVGFNYSILPSTVELYDVDMCNGIQPLIDKIEKYYKCEILYHKFEQK